HSKTPTRSFENAGRLENRSAPVAVTNGASSKVPNSAAAEPGGAAWPCATTSVQSSAREAVARHVSVNPTATQRTRRRMLRGVTAARPSHWSAAAYHERGDRYERPRRTAPRSDTQTADTSPPSAPGSGHGCAHVSNAPMSFADPLV